MDELGAPLGFSGASPGQAGAVEAVPSHPLNFYELMNVLRILDLSSHSADLGQDVLIEFPKNEGFKVLFVICLGGALFRDG